MIFCVFEKYYFEVLVLNALDIFTHLIQVTYKNDETNDLLFDTEWAFFFLNQNAVNILFSFGFAGTAYIYVQK